MARATRASPVVAAAAAGDLKGDQRRDRETDAHERTTNHVFLRLK
jgi:hypothetical protein